MLFASSNPRSRRLALRCFPASASLGKSSEDASASRLVSAVVETDRRAGTGFDHDLVTVMYQLAHAARDQPHPVFVGLDLPWNADQHPRTPPDCGRDDTAAAIPRHPLLALEVAARIPAVF